MAKKPKITETGGGNEPKETSIQTGISEQKAQKIKKLKMEAEALTKQLDQDPPE